MADVFISCSSADEAKVNEILHRLEEAGISCWLSRRDIPQGADYAVEIPNAIAACGHFLVLLSNAANESPYVMLELDLALDQKKKIIPILLELTETDEEIVFYRNEKQKIDATEDLTAAIDSVISRIKENENHGAEDQPLSDEKYELKIIKCPRCGSTNLKVKLTDFEAVLRYAFGTREGRSDLSRPLAWLMAVFLIIDSRLMQNVFVDICTGFSYICNLELNFLSVLLVLFVYERVLENLIQSVLYCVLTGINKLADYVKKHRKKETLKFQCCECKRLIRKRVPVDEVDAYITPEIIRNWLQEKEERTK